MLYFYSTREKNEKNFDRVRASCKTNVRIHEFINEGTHSLTEAYNIALSMAENDEIVVLAHDDIVLEYGFDEKLEQLFNESDYGIIGVAGSTSIGEDAVWWKKRSDLAGVVSHEMVKNDVKKIYETKFSDRHDFIMQVVCVDGVFIAVKPSKLKKKFNENIDGFHFYDVSFSLENHVAGVKVGVTTAFKIHHKSVGQTTNGWHINRAKFISEYEKILPCEITPSTESLVTYKIVDPNPVTVGVIILTKDKINILVKCIDSLINKTSQQIKLNIFIGDTGSSDESKQQLANYISTKNNIKVIDLPFYNFAKNNNEIFKTYFTDEELVLFCNNDIELINNALDIMVDTYQRNKKKVGTIGCRLLYPNNRVQHGGIVIYENKQKVVGATHLGLKSFYSGKSTKETNIIGCTGAFLLISAKNFKLLKGFNESTEECFEDVILNIESRSIIGKINYYCGDAVCYHYESLTRNEDPQQLERINKDFRDVLFPSILKHIKNINKFIIKA